MYKQMLCQQSVKAYGPSVFHRTVKKFSVMWTLKIKDKVIFIIAGVVQAMPKVCNGCFVTISTVHFHDELLWSEAWHVLIGQ